MTLLHLLVLVCIGVSMGQGKGEKVIEEAEKVIEEAVVEDEKPNIIFIMVDDVGWADFDYNTPGSSAIPTPNIDSLAEKGFVWVVNTPNGLVFLQDKTEDPLCSPDLHAFPCCFHDWKIFCKHWVTICHVPR